MNEVLAGPGEMGKLLANWEGDESELELYDRGEWSSLRVPAQGEDSGTGKGTG